MTNPELDKLLKSAPGPERPPEFWEALPGRIGAKIHWQQQRPKENVNLPPRFGWGLVWGIPGAAVLVLLGFLWGNWHGAGPATALLQNEKLIREVLATFPNQVQAIIQDENGLRLALAEEPNVAQSQPLWIKVCAGGVCRSFVTFSGQTVEIGGKPVEALVDARGGVMLVGEHFFWSSRQGKAESPLRINAEQLRFVL
jgi:hypothetical protein